MSVLVEWVMLPPELTVIDPVESWVVVADCRVPPEFMVIAVLDVPVVFDP